MNKTRQLALRNLFDLRSRLHDERAIEDLDTMIDTLLDKGL